MTTNKKPKQSDIVSEFKSLLQKKMIFRREHYLNWSGSKLAKNNLYGKIIRHAQIIWNIRSCVVTDPPNGV